MNGDFDPKDRDNDTFKFGGEEKKVSSVPELLKSDTYRNIYLAFPGPIVEYSRLNADLGDAKRIPPRWSILGTVVYETSKNAQIRVLLFGWHEHPHRESMIDATRRDP